MRGPATAKLEDAQARIHVLRATVRKQSEEIDALRARLTELEKYAPTSKHLEQIDQLEADNARLQQSLDETIKADERIILELARVKEERDRLWAAHAALEAIRCHKLCPGWAEAIATKALAGPNDVIAGPDNGADRTPHQSVERPGESTLPVGRQPVLGRSETPSADDGPGPQQGEPVAPPDGWVAVTCSDGGSIEIGSFDPFDHIEKIEAEHKMLRYALLAARSVMWMAERYAEGGGAHSIQMRDYGEVVAIVRRALEETAPDSGG